MKIASILIQLIPDAPGGVDEHAAARNIVITRDKILGAGYPWEVKLAAELHDRFSHKMVSLPPEGFSR